MHNVVLDIGAKWNDAGGNKSSLNKGHAPQLVLPDGMGTWMAAVEIRNVRKAFGSVEVLHGVSVGIAWAQGLFTLVVATAFAQIAPASWRLAEARIVDVVTGSAIGLLCGMLAWPAGAREI